MIDPKRFLEEMVPHGKILHDAVQRTLEKPDARGAALKQLITKLPQADPSRIELDRDRVTIGKRSDLTPSQTGLLEGVLKGLKPWRKGPFTLFGIDIDSEWNSALKWRRVAPHIDPLRNRKVLDVGCSNGYYLFRMAAAQPRLLLGIEPYKAYYYQYLALQNYLHLPGTYCLPLKLEDLPDMGAWFDAVFCMGILYHRRSPLDTLTRLRKMLTASGQLILETLIIPGDGETALCPNDRYARMRNVFFIPTVKCLKTWLERCGFGRVRCVDITPTTLEEQRKTAWIDSDSLETFLDPRDDTRTVEGHPAPIRAVMIASPK
jgi:tRNA (mo5U34)-methyltransferase